MGKLFSEAIRAHGDVGDKIVKIEPLAFYDYGFAIANWELTGGRYPNTSYPHANTIRADGITETLVNGYWTYLWAESPAPEARDQAGRPGQRTINPASLFTRHFLVRVDDGDSATINWYDPSYGTANSNLLSWQNASISAFFRRRDGEYQFRRVTASLEVIDLYPR